MIPGLCPFIYLLKIFFEEASKILIILKFYNSNCVIRNSLSSDYKISFCFFLSHAHDRTAKDIARYASLLSLFLSLFLLLSCYIKLSNSPSVAHVASIRAICARILTVRIEWSNLFMPIPKSRAQDAGAHRPIDRAHVVDAR